jgi:hypothetical protein
MVKKRLEIHASLYTNNRKTCFDAMGRRTRLSRRKHSWQSNVDEAGCAHTINRSKASNNPSRSNRSANA